MGRGWDGLFGAVSLPASGQTTISASFSIPLHSQAVTFFIPALAGGATVKLQSLDPAGGADVATEVWRDVKVFNLSAGGVVALAAIVGDAAVTLPTAATGAGNFRFVASADLSASPVSISVLISRL